MPRPGSAWGSPGPSHDLVVCSLQQDRLPHRRLLDRLPDGTRFVRPIPGVLIDRRLRGFSGVARSPRQRRGFPRFTPPPNAALAGCSSPRPILSEGAGITRAGRDPGRIAPDRPAGYAVAVRPGVGIPFVWRGHLPPGPGAGPGGYCNLECPCHHHSRNIGLTAAFFASARVFARKWAHRLPIATPCVVFDREGRVHLLGNADDRAGSVARAEGLCESGSDFTTEFQRKPI